MTGQFSLGATYRMGWLPPRLPSLPPWLQLTATGQWSVKSHGGYLIMPHLARAIGPSLIFDKFLNCLKLWHCSGIGCWWTQTRAGRMGGGGERCGGGGGSLRGCLSPDRSDKALYVLPWKQRGKRWTTPLQFHTQRCP